MEIEPAETEIFYFSGTGNSLFVARELAKRLPRSRVHSITSCLGQETIRTGGDVIGLVLPVHAMSVPTAVKQFLSRADLRPAKYVFAIATRLGPVFEDLGALDKLLRKQRLTRSRGLSSTGSAIGPRTPNSRSGWRKDVLCPMCYACLNFCPKRAVQIKGIRGVVRSFSPTNERYSHPYATVKDVAAQKLADAEGL